MPLPTTRREALEIRADTYISDKPCPQGHRTGRSVKNMSCRQCDKSRSKAKAASLRRPRKPKPKPVRIRIARDEWPEIIRLYTEQGMFMREISELLGFPELMIGRVIDHMKIPRFTRKPKVEVVVEDPQWIDYYKPLGRRMSGNWTAKAYAGQRYTDIVLR